MKFKFLGKLRNGDDGNSGSTGNSRGTPTEEVRSLTQQGYSESEITEELRDQGYSYTEINRAMNSAVRESARRSGGRGQGGPDTMAQDQQFDDEWEDDGEYYEDDYYDDYEDDQPQGRAQPANTRGGNSAAPAQGQGDGTRGAPRQYEDSDWEQPPAQDAGGEDADAYTEEEWSPDSTISAEQEELIEIIVAEHMTEVEDEFDRIYTDLEKLQDVTEDLKERVEEMEVRKDEDEKMFLQKVNEMEQHFEQTHSRMGGMEKALREVMPALVENVRELSSVVKEMKQDQA